MLQLLALIITDITSFAVLWISSTFRQSVRSFSSYLAPKTRPRASPPSSSSPLPHSLSPPISAVPKLTIDRLRVLCRPAFEEEQLNNPKLAWVGVFQRGTQHPDSDINFLVGFDPVDNLCDVYSIYGKLKKRLQQILCRDVNLVEYIQVDPPHVYASMEALLTAETIWGPPLWKLSSREAAKRLLKKEYETTKKALQAASRLEKRLVSYKAEFEYLKNKNLRLSMLEDALFVITAVQTSHNRFDNKLKYMFPLLANKAYAIRAGKEGAVESREDLKDIWCVIFSWKIADTLEEMMYAAEQLFSRAGFKP